MKKNAKALSLALAAVISGTAVFSCSEKSSSSSDSTSYPELTVTFLDVGKADSMILRSETSTVIIDCGEKGDGKTITSLLEEDGVTSVDCLIITHYDKDHVGGASKVIKNFDVKRVLAPDYEEESEEMGKYQKALDEKGLTPELLTSDVSFTLDDIDFTVYAPQKTFYGEDDDNDFSLVTKAVHHDNVLLFTGDAMEQRLDEIMDIGECTLLKVPYHGRKLENLADFLTAVKPKSAVVCTSKGEFASQTQNLLLDMDIPTWSTCFNGNITAVSNGKTITITSDK